MSGLRRLYQSQYHMQRKLVRVGCRLTRVLHNNITLLVLVVSQRQQDNVALVDPDLLPQLAADMGETAGAVEALGFQTTVSEHLDDLGVFLAFLFEDEFALFVVVLVLTPTSVFTSLVVMLAGASWHVRGSAASPRHGKRPVVRFGRQALGEVAGQPLQKSAEHTFPLFFGMVGGSRSWCGCGWSCVWCWWQKRRRAQVFM